MTYNEKKTLYESIMNEIAKQVKYALNKSEHINESYQSSIITSFINIAQKLSKNGKQYVVEIYGNISNEYVSFIRGKRGYNSNKFDFKFGDLTDECFDGQILKGKKAQDCCDSLKRDTEAALAITSWNEDDEVYSKQKDDFVHKVLYAVKFSEKGIEMCKEIKEKRNQRQENKKVPTENDIKEEREKRLVNLKCEKRFNEDKKGAEE